MRTSYSALNTYRSCPLKYKYQEIDKIKVPKSKEQIFGSAVHESLRFMFVRNPLYPTLDEVLNFFDENWLGRVSKTEISEEEKNIYRKEGTEMIKNFYKKNRPWNFNVVDLESRFEFALEPFSNRQNSEFTAVQTIVAGIIDRIDKNSDKEYEIIDYKTAARMPSQETIDKDLQMSIYHLSILKRWPALEARNIKLSFYFLKHNEKISTLRTEQEMDKTKKQLFSMIKEIEEKRKNNNFPPLPSALCGWCGYRKICPMWKHENVKTQMSNVKSQNEIEKIIKEYIELKEESQKMTKKIAELQKELHEFMDGEKIERVFGDNVYITRRVKENLSYDLEKTREILEPLGLWKEILKVDERLLNKIIVKLTADIQEKFKSIAKEKKITKTLTISKLKN